MNKELENLIIEIAKIPTISKKGAEKIAFNLLNNQQNSELILKNIGNILANFYIDKETNSIRNKENNPIIDNSILYIFENNKEAYNVLKKIGWNKAQFIVGFSSKSDYTNIEKINLLMDRLIKYIIKIDIKELIIFIPPCPETELLFQVTRQKLLDENLGEIKVTKLATGIPFNGSIEYLDEYTLKEALNNRGEK